MGTTRLKVAFAGLAAILTVLWLLSLPAGTFTGGFWPLRNSLVYLSGIPGNQLHVGSRDPGGASHSD